MTHNAEKKSYTVICRGKNLTQTKSPIPPFPTKVEWLTTKWVGKKRIWHLSKCRPLSTKWLARVHQVVVFKTKVLHFKIENTSIKETNGKRKFKRMLSFLFVDKRILLLWNCLWRSSTLFSSRWIRAFGMFWTKAARFRKKLEVHSVLYGQGKYVFKREFLCL